MIFLILFLIVIILLVNSYKTGNLNYVYQQPSPFGLYTPEDCNVACSEKAGNEEACKWCETKTPMMGLTDENIRNSFIQLVQH